MLAGERADLGVMRRIRQALAPVGGLLRNAVTGALALLLLLLLGGCAALTPVGGAGRRLMARMLVLVDALTGYQRSWAARVLGRELGEMPRHNRTRREVTWLAVHALTGPAGLVLIGALFYAVDVIWHLRTAESNSSVTLALSLAIAAFTAMALVAIPLLHRSQARLVELVLRPESLLALRVRELTDSRAAVADAQAAELRRIERDLHDGAQARLISMRMNLGLARSMRDPDQVRELVQEAWESAGQALADLRDLLRGIHPPVLADRGLAGAIEAATLLCPIPVDLEIDLAVRPDAPTEAALYFAAVEALTNVTRHSGATKAWVRLGRTGGVLRLLVGDDGRGGADPAAGTGIDGIRRRLSAFDGTLALHSPSGGPSELIMEIPCALSSPKI